MKVSEGDTVWFESGNLKQNWGKVLHINPNDDGLHEIIDGETHILYMVSEKEITGYANPALHRGS